MAHDEDRDGEIASAPLPPPPPNVEARPSGFSRREFLKGAGAAAAVVGVSAPAAAAILARHQTPAAPAGPRTVGPGPTPLVFTVNGGKHSIEVEPSATLLDTVRDRLGLTGAKRVCDRGSCGACTMLIDGQPANACTVLAIDAAGHDITTVEGLSDGDKLTPLEQAFVECDALQCGFCTPGMVVTCSALLARNAHPTRAETADAIAGNICRCGTYQNIFEAVELAAKRKGSPR